VNTDTGAIRPLPPDEVVTDREVELLEREVRVLARYQPEYRPELLRRWRAGLLMLDHGELVDASKAAQRIRSAKEAYAHRKRRRHEAAESRARNRKRR